MFPALDIRPVESPLQQMGGALQLKSALQQQQIGAVQLQEAKINAQSRQALMSIWAQNNGDPNATIQQARESGKVTPDDLYAFQTHTTDLQTKAALLTKDQLDNHAKIAEMAANELDSLKAYAGDPSSPAVKAKLFPLLNQSYARLSQAGGPDTQTWLDPVMKDLLANPSPENFQRKETFLMGEKWVNQNAQEALKLASQPTAAQA